MRTEIREIAEEAVRKIVDFTDTFRVEQGKAHGWMGPRTRMSQVMKIHRNGIPIEFIAVESFIDVESAREMLDSLAEKGTVFSRGNDIYSIYPKRDSYPFGISSREEAFK